MPERKRVRASQRLFSMILNTVHSEALDEVFVDTVADVCATVRQQSGGLQTVRHREVSARTHRQ
jgi:hypothetical protein